MTVCAIPCGQAACACARVAPPPPSWCERHVHAVAFVSALGIVLLVGFAVGLAV